MDDLKIYTRKGDDGTTSLAGGKRVSKSDIRIEAYGTVDELIAYTGLLRDQPVDETHKKTLLRIQDKLMACAAILAADFNDCRVKLPVLHEKEIAFLEQEMDALSMKLPLLQSFIIPGGHPAVSFSHIARTICRRAERRIIELTATSEVPLVIIQYMNRLSDYFFVLSRSLSLDFQLDEIKWIANAD